MSVSRILKSLTSVRAARAGFEAAFFALQQDRYIITPGDEGIETGHRTLSMYCRLLQQEGKSSISFLDDTTKAAGDYSRFIRSGLCGYSLPQEPFEASHIPGADAGWRATLTAINKAFGRCEAAIRALQQDIRVLRTSAVPPDAAKVLNLDHLCLHETLSIKCQTLIHLYRLLTDTANAIKQMRNSRRLAMERQNAVHNDPDVHAHAAQVPQHPEPAMAGIDLNMEAPAED